MAINVLETPVVATPSSPPAALDHLLHLEEEQIQLKQQLCEVEEKLKGFQASYQEAVTHCTLAKGDVHKLHEQLDNKGKHKSNCKVNTDACLLTPLEGKSNWFLACQKELEEQRVEAAKVQAKADALKKQVHEWIKTVDTWIFKFSFSHYTQKDDLLDIAACFGLNVPEKIKNPDLHALIKMHMDSKPDLLDDIHFRKLFGLCGKAKSPEGLKK
ncbi:hypothetical protein M422DRAFT_259416 [Sphaerobolus stellatus SS14]|uniref:Uncharacterized protein n=1 Tax=Sphaerobolus stellatus (strain SS14) TaxID=990650 RepID=A0A0C9UT32_SPHS4|nr:hypothetical protein M422DRAFT_259416 [Sphaerobolus stellatus SS14]